MIFTSDCMYCLLNRQYEMTKDFPDEKKKAAFMREVLSAVSQNPDGVSAPVLYGQLSRIHQKYFGALYDYADEKKLYNDLMLSIKERLEKKVSENSDPLLTAFKLSRAANYIDFGAMKKVDDDMLFSLIENCAATPFDERLYARLLKEMENASSLVILTDNCGEVVCDMILADEIYRRFPSIKLSAIVRGEAALNDVTMEDAAYVGLDKHLKVISNGTNIAGTSLSDISPEAKAVIDESDIIISKGQANFETLAGCGLNVYYVFLCKCDMFTRLLGVPKFEGLFLAESDLCLNEAFL